MLYQSPADGCEVEMWRVAITIQPISGSTQVLLHDIEGKLGSRKPASPSIYIGDWSLSSNTFYGTGVEACRA